MLGWFLCESQNLFFSWFFRERHCADRTAPSPIKFTEFRFLLSQRHHQSRISTGRRTIPQWEEVVAPIEIKKIIPPLTHAQEQPVCPPLQVCLDATLTGKDSRELESNQDQYNYTSKGNIIDQEFSSIREPFLNREIIIPLKFKKKKNIPPPFSPLGAFLDADDDDNDENTNKGSNSWMIKPARNKPDDYEKQNLKQSSWIKRRSSLSRASICGGIACPFPFFCRSNSDVYVPNVKGIPLSS